MLERLYCSRGTGGCFRHVRRDDTFFDMPRRPSLVAAAAAALCLAACAGSPVAGEPATTPVPPGATAAATLAPGEQPSFAFAGDCDSMVTEAEIEDLVGADITPLSAQPGGRASAVEVLGGLACGWGGGDYAWYVVLTVIPAEGLEATIAEYSYPGDHDCWGQNEVGAEGACYFGRVVAGYWLAGVFQVESGTGLLPTDSIDGLAAIVEARATDHPATPVAFPAGMWKPMQCGALSAGVAEKYPGESGAVSGTTPTGFVGPGFPAATATVGALRCNWSNSHRFVTELMPGAGWAIERLTDTAPIVVDGAVAAVVQHEDDGSARITATDGVNLAWITAAEGVSEVEAAAFLAAVMRAAAG
ncbi:hypothetical protein [Agromyces bauzanensis]